MADEIERQDDGDITILSVPARLDTIMSESLEEICNTIAGEGRYKVVVDCADLEFLNSNVIRILVSFHQKASKNGGDLKLANVTLPVEDVLRLTKLDQVFRWYPSVNEAVAAF